MFVYVVAADNGEVKVGYSGTPYARLSHIKRDYRKARGFRNAVLYAFVKTSDAIAVEYLAIQELLPFAVGGEWFKCEPERALLAVLRAAEADAPLTTVTPSGAT